MRSIIIGGLMAIAATLGSPRAQAQQHHGHSGHSGSMGNWGHWGHSGNWGWNHHRPGWNGYGYGYGYQYPVYPTTYVQPTQYVVPTQSVAPAVAAQDNAIPYQGPGVVVMNPGATGGSVTYAIDDAYQYSMAPGQTQRLSSKGSWTIAFNRGGSFGNARYTLTEGNYEFVVGSQGWDIRRQAVVTQAAADMPPAPPDAAANILP